ncbi:hypothetical protein ACE38W_13035 [Chitinophaga sp. Hz27]|uniref:hypothetical protein n=1 Tax=Chitinophaga sp. Hz27 TaxID=3347169 RepID=UPI0035E1CEA5
MKYIAIFLLLLVFQTSSAQQNDPVSTVKKLFTLLDNPKSFINKEDQCYKEVDGLDILKLNKPYIKEYLSNLKNAGLFSPAYLAAQEKYYQHLEKDIVKQGYASNRDADEYTLSQDPPENKDILAVLSHTKPVIAGDNATITMTFKNYTKYKLIYKLVKANNNWLIDKIDVSFK